MLLVRPYFISLCLAYGFSSFSFDVIICVVFVWHTAQFKMKCEHLEVKKVKKEEEKNTSIGNSRQSTERSTRRREIKQFRFYFYLHRRVRRSKMYEAFLSALSI